MKDKNVYYILIFIIIAFGLYWLNQRNILAMRNQLYNWANTDKDIDSRTNRITAIGQLTNSEVRTMNTIVTKYLNTNTQLPVELQQFWDYLNNKYSIGG